MQDGEAVDAGTESDSNVFHKLYYHYLGTPQVNVIVARSIASTSGVAIAQLEVSFVFILHRMTSS